MSKNNKNKIKPAFMQNFCRYEIERYIIIDEDGVNLDDQTDFVKEINKRLWYAIQEVNAICKGRILPFVKIRLAVRESDNKYIRIVVSTMDSEKSFEDMVDNRISIDKLSHLIVFKTLEPGRVVMVSDELVRGNAKMLIDKQDQMAAAVDIFLDIAMFNSFSFLRNMSDVCKKEFSSQKYNFFKSVNGYCYYRYINSNDEPPAYYSFAFSARLDDKSIDFDEYVCLWESFIETHYSNMKNEVPHPCEQLKLHVDVEDIPKKYRTEAYWKKINNGDYLLLKINKGVKTRDEKRKIINYLGFRKYCKKPIKLVPLNEYHNPQLKRWLKQLNISAFKIVVDI